MPILVKGAHRLPCIVDHEGHIYHGSLYFYNRSLVFWMGVGRVSAAVYVLPCDTKAGQEKNLPILSAVRDRCFQFIFKVMWSVRMRMPGDPPQVSGTIVQVRT